LRKLKAYVVLFTTLLLLSLFVFLLIKTFDIALLLVSYGYYQFGFEVMNLALISWLIFYVIVLDLLTEVITRAIMMLAIEGEGWAISFMRNVYLDEKRGEELEKKLMEVIGLEHAGGNQGCDQGHPRHAGGLKAKGGGAPR